MIQERGTRSQIADRGRSVRKVGEGHGLSGVDALAGIAHQQPLQGE